MITGRPPDSDKPRLCIEIELPAGAPVTRTIKAGADAILHAEENTVGAIAVVFHPYTGSGADVSECTRFHTDPALYIQFEGGRGGADPDILGIGSVKDQHKREANDKLVHDFYFSSIVEKSISRVATRSSMAISSSHSFHIDRCRVRFMNRSIDTSNIPCDDSGQKAKGLNGGRVE